MKSWIGATAALTALGAGYLYSTANALGTGQDSKSFPVRSFSSLTVSGAFTISMSPGQPSIVAEGHADDLRRITINKEGDSVWISTQKGDYKWKGDVKLNIKGQKVDDLGLHGANRGKIDIGSCQSLTVLATGANKVQFSGKATSLNLEASGASMLDLSKLPASDAHVNISGATTVKVMANKLLDGSASGACTVLHQGSAKSKIKSSGVSRVSTL